METIIHNLDEMDTFAEQYRVSLMNTNAVKNNNSATVVGLSGELGAGKTALVKSFAKALGISESVPSPTFVIARFYSLKGNLQFSQLIHIDAYRIESIDELRPLGWERLLSEKKNLIVVEWPEKMETAFPADALMLKLSVIDETTRMIRA